MESYSVRCLFRWRARPDQRAKHLYEERITLWSADSLDQAIELAETEATTYANDGDKFLGYSQAYALPEPIAAHGVEVFSLLRESDLEPREYIDTFFDTGAERQR
jgi:hypothetical protein